MRIYLYFLIAILLVSTGCHTDRPSLSILSHADSVLDSLPDSALNILSTIDVEDLETREEKARYSLLYTMALLKTEHEIHSDSLLIPAIEYFGKTNIPSREAMLTHFAKAALSDSALQKIEEYDKTIELAAGKNIKVYHALALFNKGNVYGQAYSSPDELECTKQGLKIIHETCDTASIIYGHLIYGMGLNSNDESRRALKEFITGMEISQKAEGNPYLPLLSREKAYTQSLLGEDDQAVHGFDSLLNACGVEFTPKELYAFARSAAATGNFALADQIMASLAEEDTAENKCDHYFSQAVIMAYRGDYKGAYNAINLAIPYSNGIVMEKLDGNLSRQEKEIALLTATHQREIAERLSFQKILISLCSLTAIALMCACVYILVLRHRRKIREEYLKREHLKAEAKAETDALMMRIEQLDTSNRFSDEVLKSLRVDMNDLERQKRSLEGAVSGLEENIRILEKEVKSKEEERALQEERTRIYSEAAESLRSQLKVNDETISRIKRQSVRDFMTMHRGIADFCNEVPKGMSSPNALSLYETERDLRLGHYKDEKTLESLASQINDLMGDILEKLKNTQNLTESDVRTLIYAICGFNYKSIASLLGVSPTAAAARRSRLKEKIHASYDSIPEESKRYIQL